MVDLLRVAHPLRMRSCSTSADRAGRHPVGSTIGTQTCSGAFLFDYAILASSGGRSLMAPLATEVRLPQRLRHPPKQDSPIGNKSVARGGSRAPKFCR